MNLLARISLGEAAAIARGLPLGIVLSRAREELRAWEQ